MKRVIYLFGAFLCINLSVMANNTQPLDTLVVKQNEDSHDKNGAPDYDIEISLSDLDISLDDLEDLERDQSLSLSEKASMFMAYLSFQAAKAQEVAHDKFKNIKITFENARQTTTDHIYENQKAYTIGLILGVTATITLVALLRPDLFFGAPVTT